MAEAHGSNHTPLLCRSVEVRFGRTVALAGLDLEAANGRITGLVGPNGAGKTTTLRLAAGLVQAAGGTVRVLGLDPIQRPTTVRRRIGFLPDRPQLPAHLTARELLELRAALYGLERAEIARRLDQVIEELALASLLDRWCRVLSHGQAQRVALAAVLMPQPELLLVDEPMTALDLEAQMRVRAVLRQRTEDGAATVITTHTVDHIAALADDVVHLRDGHVAGTRPGTRDARELEQWLLGFGESGDVAD
jgi:ABC-type multidrug transport system ATPase subunit